MKGRFGTVKSHGGKLLAIATTAVALTAGALVPSASASPAAPHHVAQWGMAVIDIDPTSSSVARHTIVNTGGGTWSFGYEYTTSGKRCYSNYYHGKKRHSSTVKMANGTYKDYAVARDYSNAHRTAGAAFTCSAYWATYSS